MNVSNAWLLNLGADRVGAIGERELLHVVAEPEAFEVPLAPTHCRYVLIWQDRLLPVWDVSARLIQCAELQRPVVAAVVGYQARRGETPWLGAIALTEPPTRCKVTDSQACELPENEPAWFDIAHSCFAHDDRPVPILDLYTMFSGSMPVEPVAGNPLPSALRESMRETPVC